MCAVSDVCFSVFSSQPTCISSRFTRMAAPPSVITVAPCSTASSTRASSATVSTPCHTPPPHTSKQCHICMALFTRMCQQKYSMMLLFYIGSRNLCEKSWSRSTLNLPHSRSLSLVLCLFWSLCLRNSSFVQFMIDHGNRLYCLLVQGALKPVISKAYT